MKKHLLLALSLSTQVHSFESNYWEEVFNTSMERQAEAKLANFRDFPLQNEPSSVFGMRLHPITQENRLHHGIDFPGNEGDPFIVVAHGTVVFSGDNGSMGMTIAVDHGGGLVTRYGHAKSLNYAVGDKVRRGDEIGTIGATGMVTGPHLHFEVIQDGEHIDPQEFIAQRRTLSVDELRKQLMESPAVDIGSYVENQLQNRQAISNESFEGFVVEKAVSDFDNSIKVNHLVTAADSLQSQIDEFAEHKAQQILEKFSTLELPATEPFNGLDNQNSLENQVASNSLAVMPLTNDVQTDVDPVEESPLPETEDDSPAHDQGIYTKRTLWAIADEIKPLSSSVYQSMYAIFELNPEAFPSGNMNQRYLDVAIKLPGHDEISSVDPVKAKSKYYDDLAAHTEPVRLAAENEKQIAPQ